MPLERLPLANNSLRTLRQAVAEYGPLFDLLALRTRDYILWQDHFQGDTLNATYALSTSSGATAWAINAGAGGRVVGITGNTDNERATLYVPTSTLTGNMDACISAKVQLSAIASVKCEIGFSNDPTTVGFIDNLDAGTNVPTLVAGATDGVVAIFDVDAARDNWQFAGARASTAWRDSTLGAAAGTGITHPVPVADTYQWVTVRLLRSERGATDQMSAELYVDGVLKAKKVDAAIDGTVAVYPYILVMNRATNANVTMRMDAWEYYALPDVTA